jgi:RNA polymerase sigma-70 factor (ECF subfamily)
VVAAGSSAPAPAPVDPGTVARFQRGDREAFLIVHDACAPALRPLVARFFPRPFEREEALQEVWLHAYRIAATYDPARGELVPWLRAVAVNRCKELLRARGRRPDARASLDEGALARLLAGEPDPEVATRAERLRAAVARFSATLSGEEAAVFRLSLLEERTHEEVAAALGTSARRCKYLRSKLLARAAAHPELRAALEEVIDG